MTQTPQAGRLFHNQMQPDSSLLFGRRLNVWAFRGWG
jgi:hypothetical protein